MPRFVPQGSLVGPAAENATNHDIATTRHARRHRCRVVALSSSCRVLCLLVSAVALLAGCSLAPPAELKDEPEIQKLSRAPAAVSLALAPVTTGYSTAADLEKEPGRIPAIVDAGAFSAALVQDVSTYTGFAKPVVLEPAAGDRRPTDAPDLRPWFKAAADRGAEVLLVPRLREFEVAFDKRNGAWIPNVMLWLYLWIPAWWVHDEDFMARAKLECAFYSVASEQLLFKDELIADERRSLNSFDRGWDVLGIFRHPASLDLEQMRRVNDLMTPYALRALEKKATVEVGDRLPKFMADEATRKDFAERNATVYALLVGCARYRDDATVVGPAGAFGDVADVAALLRDKLGVPEKNVVALRNAEATRYRVLDEIAKFLARRTKPEDTVLVYFSGCGTNGPGAEGAREAYLLPYDADARDLAGTAIALGGLAEKLRQLPARRAVVIADAAFGPGHGGQRSLKGPAAPEAPPPATAFERASRAGAGHDLTLFLAAGGADAGAAEDALDLAEAKRGLFTYLLLEGARGRADTDASGDVSTEELAAYVARQVKEQAGLEGATQVPALYRAGARVPVDGATGGRSWLPVVRARS